MLNLSEMLVPNDKWESYRSRILDITNNARRNMEEELKQNYNIKYDPAVVCEDIVEVRSPATRSLSNKLRRGKGNEDSRDKKKED